MPQCFYVCPIRQDIHVRAYKCAVSHKSQQLKQQMEESDHMLNAMELRQDVPTVEELLESPLSCFILLQTVVVTAE